MSAHQFIRITLRLLETALVIVAMFAPLPFMFLLGGPTSVLVIWFVSEFLSAAILTTLVVESIFACAYELQAYGNLAFQAFKLALWTIVTVSTMGCWIDMATRRGGGHVGFIYVELPLLFVWAVFIVGYLYAYFYYRDVRKSGSDDENAPLLAADVES